MPRFPTSRQFTTFNCLESDTSRCRSASNACSRWSIKRQPGECSETPRWTARRRPPSRFGTAPTGSPRRRRNLPPGRRGLPERCHNAGLSMPTTAGSMFGHRRRRQTHSGVDGAAPPVSRATPHDSTGGLFVWFTSNLGDQPARYSRRNEQACRGWLATEAGRSRRQHRSRRGPSDRVRCVRGLTSPTAGMSRRRVSVLNFA